MEQTKSTWLTELSFFLVLPTLIYIFFSSSSVWAKGNPYWSGFYNFFSSPNLTPTFNFWAAIIFVGGSFVAFLFSVFAIISSSLKENSNAKEWALEIIMAFVSGSVLASLLLFFAGLNIFSAILH